MSLNFDGAAGLGGSGDMTTALQTPVALVVFNRPDTTRRVFAAVREARPVKLLLIADGPRLDRPGEAELCDEVRGIVTAVDWPCEVHTNFSGPNLGCHPRVISGYDWVFSLVEEAILLEDDTLPDPTFFRFCQEMLERFRGDSRIAAVTGTNYVQDESSTIRDSYLFCIFGSLWGWATWRERWQEYDRHMEHWADLRETQALSRIFDDARTARWWTEIFDRAKEQGNRAAWDYLWQYTNLFRHRLTIVPNVNLVQNLGFGAQATHTKNENKRLMPAMRQMQFPLRHPAAVIWDRRFDREFQALKYPTPAVRISNKVNRTLASIRGEGS